MTLARGERSCALSDCREQTAIAVDNTSLTKGRIRDRSRTRGRRPGLAIRFGLASESRPQPRLGGAVVALAFSLSLRLTAHKTAAQVLECWPLACALFCWQPPQAIERD